MQRRGFLKTLAVCGALVLTGASSLLRTAFAATKRNKPAFSKADQVEALDSLFPGRTIEPSSAIDIGVHDLVENGAVVPLKINSTLPAIDSISILVEKNPNPLIAHFKLSPRCQAFIATRIKVQNPSMITAVVDSEGRLYSAQRFVEVIEGGCG